ncbi:cobalamin B12-binding domain-containing protein [Streptomyces collinus]
MAGTGGADVPGGLAERLWTAVIGRDEPAAVQDVCAAAASGMSEETLLLDVIAGVQHRVGVEWAADRMSVAEEHAATAISDRVIAALAHRTPTTRQDTPDRGRVTVACVDGEWHALPARLLAEVLIRRGWRVDFLGAQTPTPHLIAHVQTTNPDALLLSASIPTHLPTAHSAITAVQSIGTPVMVGGAAFGGDGRYARLLGADAWAPDARHAARLLAETIAGTARPQRQEIDDLPHLADQEYTFIKRNRTTLVRQSLADLADRWQAMRSYTPAQSERTAEDIAHIVDYLATALYVDDVALFTTFVTWTADVLTARHVPARSLRLGLDVLAAPLHDFPRALAFLTTAGQALSAPRPSSGPGITA